MGGNWAVEGVGDGTGDAGEGVAIAADADGEAEGVFESDIQFWVVGRVEGAVCGEPVCSS